MEIPLKSPIFWTILFLNILPILTGFIFINLFATDVPYHDQFDEEVPKILHYYDGSLKASEFLSVNNDHRPIVVHIITFLLYRITAINVIIEANLGYALHILAFCILFLLLKTVFPNIHPFGLYLLPVTWFFFNLYLISAYLWGILLSSSLCLVALFSMVYFNHRSTGFDWFFAGAIAAAVLGTFSWIAGLFLWPAGLVQIVFSHPVERNKKSAVWLVVMIAILLINYVILGFPSKGVHGYEGYSRYLITLLQHPLPKAICFIEAVGSNMIHEVISALLFGFVLLSLLFCIIIHEGKRVFRPENIPWLTITLYATLVILALVVGRSGDGVHFGPADNLVFLPAARHFPSVFMFMIGLYGLALGLFVGNMQQCISHEGKDKAPDPKTGTGKYVNSFILLGFMIALLFSGYILHFRPGISNGVLWEEENHENWVILRNYQTIDDKTLQKIGIDRSTAEKLDQYSLSVFKGQSPGLYRRIVPASLRERLLLYANK